MARGDYSGRVTRRPPPTRSASWPRAFNRMADDLAAVDRAAPRPGRQRLPRAAHPARRRCAPCWRTSSTGWPPPDPATCGRRSTRPERLGALVGDLLDLVPGRRRCGAAAASPRCRSRSCSTRRVAEARVDRPRGARTTSTSTRRASTCHGRPRPAAPAGRQPARQRRRGTARPGGVVRVTGGGDGDGWRLEVADDGPGSPAADRDRVFERFGTLAEPDGGGGTGLGLAIARWVTELHGGTIHFVDPAGATGARVRVDLPRVRPRRRPTGPPGAHPAARAAPSAATAAPAAAPAAGPRARPRRPRARRGCSAVLARRAAARPRRRSLRRLGGRPARRARAARTATRPRGLRSSLLAAGGVPAAQPCTGARRSRWPAPRCAVCCALPVVLRDADVDRGAVPAGRRRRLHRRGDRAAARCPRSCSAGSPGRSPACGAALVGPHRCAP